MNVEDMENRQEQTLKNIQNLQNMEKKLYDELNTASANGKDTTSLINKINELSEIRINMFREMNDMLKMAQSNVANNRVDLVDQITVTKVIENQLNNAKQNLSSLSNKKADKLRMVEINTYYSEKYKAQTELMKLIIYTCVPILIIIILNKKEMVPDSLTNYIILFISVIGAYFVISKIYDISMRDNMDFQKYDWKKTSTLNEGPTVYEYDMGEINNIGKDVSGYVDSLKNSSTKLGCIDEGCCAKGTVFDKDKNKCVEAYSNILPYSF